MKKYIWAFDVSLSNTGISIFTNDGICEFVTSIDTAKAKTRAEKLRLIGKKINKIREIYEPEVIVFEKGFVRFNISTQAIFEVFGVVKYLFSECQQIEYPATTIKKIVGGKGNMKKDELMKIINEKYPMIKFSNYDQSDSYAVGLCYFIEKGII